MFIVHRKESFRDIFVIRCPDRKKLGLEDTIWQPFEWRGIVSFLGKCPPLPPKKTPGINTEQIQTEVRDGSAGDSNSADMVLSAEIDGPPRMDVLLRARLRTWVVVDRSSCHPVLVL